MALRFATRIGAHRFAQIDSQKNPIFIKLERFARITSNLRFACFSAQKRDSQKKRGSVREASSDLRESGDSRDSENRFPQIRSEEMNLRWLKTRLTLKIAHVHRVYLREAGGLFFLGTTCSPEKIQGTRLVRRTDPAVRGSDASIRGTEPPIRGHFDCQKRL